MHLYFIFDLWLHRHPFNCKTAISRKWHLNQLSVCSIDNCSSFSKVQTSNNLGHLCQLSVHGKLLLSLLLAIADAVTPQLQGFSRCPSKSQKNLRILFCLFFLFGNFPFRLRSISILPVAKGWEKLVELRTMPRIKNWTTMGQCRLRAKSEKGAASSRGAKGGQLSNLSWNWKL